MIEVMKRSDWLLAKDAFLAFIPFADDVPDEAVAAIAFDLLQAFLTSVLALGPAGTLFEA